MYNLRTESVRAALNQTKLSSEELAMFLLTKFVLRERAEKGSRRSVLRSSLDFTGTTHSGILESRWTKGWSECAV